MAKRATNAERDAAHAKAENANLGMTEEDAAAGANMAEQSEAAKLEQEERNAEAAKAADEEAKTAPRVALGTAEAIALGVGNGDSPTSGDRPEGWELMAKDVRTSSETAGELAEIDASAELALDEAELEREAKVAEALVEAEERQAEKSE